MYYFNPSGENISFQFKGILYTVLAWEHLDLPEELYEYIEEKQLLIEVDYERYIADFY